MLLDREKEWNSYFWNCHWNDPWWTIQRIPKKSLIYHFRLLVTGICNMGFFGSLLSAGQKRQVLWDFPTYERKEEEEGFMGKLLLHKIVSGVWFGLLGTLKTNNNNITAFVCSLLEHYLENFWRKPSKLRTFVFFCVAWIPGVDR